MNQPLEAIVDTARLLIALPGVLRRPLQPGEARAAIERRLAERERAFLEQARRAIYSQPASPYRRLLAWAGCEYGDLEQLLADDGLEGALRSLLRRGVYLTVDEFKGRRPVVRGSASLTVDPARLRNPGLRPHAQVQTSGSRGPRLSVPIDLAFVRDNAINAYLALEARGGLGWRHALWAVPGSAAAIQLMFAAMGIQPARWFSQVDPTAAGLHPRYRWSGRLIRWASLLAGAPLPSPEYVPLAAASRIARWLAAELRAGQTPHLAAYVSAAVRICEVALAEGLDLNGAQFSVGGEPTTAARLAAIRRSGASAYPEYGSMEAGGIATECLAPAAPDDVHFCHDRLALLQPLADAPLGLPPKSLLLSSLLPTAPFVLFNLSTGDQAELSERACGCPRERPGLTTHLQTIRSFEKLTAGGMTFLAFDVVRAIEEVLPARFGGGPTDYQLLEAPAANGEPDLRLLVRPGLGLRDPAAVADAFLGAIGTGSGAERVMALQWRQAGLPRVEWREPLTTASGKVSHLHLADASQQGEASASAVPKLPTATD